MPIISGAFAERNRAGARIPVVGVGNLTLVELDSKL